MQPLLSIVIANYNYGRFLEDAIQSVLSQSCQDFELVICDGGSTDASVEIIKKYAKELPPNTSYYEWITAQQALTTNGQRLTTKLTWWCSEKDKGQSDAFRKGFAQSRGKFLTWLNADDVMLPKTIEKLKLGAEKYPKCEWFVGGCVWLDPLLRIFKCGRARHFSAYRAKFGNVSVSGPSSFFSQNLYDRVGGIDECFKYTMDMDLWLRFVIQGNAVYRLIASYVWGLRLHPEAKMSGHKFRADGTIMDGNESRIAFLKNIERLDQIKKERQLTLQKTSCRGDAMPYFARLFSADISQSLLSRYDTWRLKGKALRDVMALIVD